jgi:predicted metal-dependent peptidase
MSEIENTTATDPKQKRFDRPMADITKEEPSVTSMREFDQRLRWEAAIADLEGVSLHWYLLATRLPLKVARGWCSTAATDGKAIYWNPEFSEALNDRELRFVLMHELFHVSGGHIWRGGKFIQEAERKDRSKTALLTNLAMDGSIHQAIFPLMEPGKEYADFAEKLDCAFYEPRFDDRSFEEIYKMLLQDMKDGKLNIIEKTIHIYCGKAAPGDAPDGAAQGQNGEWVLVVDEDGNPVEGPFKDEIGNSPKDGKEESKGKKEDIPLEKDIKGIAKDAMDEARDTKAGIDPGESLRKAANNIAQKKIAWADILRQFMVHNARHDYTFARPNRRYLHQGLVFPSLKSGLLEGVIAVDVSGSIDRQTYTDFVAHINDIRAEIPDHTLHVLFCDTLIQREQKLGMGSELDSSVVGGGGTNFKPVFDYIDCNVPNPKFLIYFTDGDNYDRESILEPHYPVMWALNGSYIREQEFGENLKIEKT